MPNCANSRPTDITLRTILNLALMIWATISRVHSANSNLGLLEIEWVILGFKVVKGPVDIGFWRLGPARRSGIMRDGEIGQGTASAVGWIFVRGLSGARDRSWRIW